MPCRLEMWNRFGGSFWRMSTFEAAAGSVRSRAEKREF